MFLAIKTASDTTELFLLNGKGEVIQNMVWESGRQLSDHLLTKMTELIGAENYSWPQINGLIVFRGPGSFTGLRIGATVANTIAFVRNVPIVGAEGGDWVGDGIKKLNNSQNDSQVIPNYGSEPNISKPRK